eukprot:scpid58865/ scgid11873/ 
MHGKDGIRLGRHSHQEPVEQKRHVADQSQYKKNVQNVYVVVIVDKTCHDRSVKSVRLHRRTSSLMFQPVLRGCGLRRVDLNGHVECATKHVVSAFTAQQQG